MPHPAARVAVALEQLMLLLVSAVLQISEAAEVAEKD
jgi:hypothetical protein